MAAPRYESRRSTPLACRTSQRLASPVDAMIPGAPAEKRHADAEHRFDLYGHPCELHLDRLRAPIHAHREYCVLRFGIDPAAADTTGMLLAK